jgi:ribose/xylose/arabinose/galactoside ABC-type transport system permease subunit
MIGIIDDGLSILGVATFWQYIVQGLLLISPLRFRHSEAEKDVGRRSPRHGKLCIPRVHE